jgi:hypothetical protein
MSGFGLQPQVCSSESLGKFIHWHADTVQKSDLSEIVARSPYNKACRIELGSRFVYVENVVINW